MDTHDAKTNGWCSFSIEAPATVRAGHAVELTVAIRNTSQAALKFARTLVWHEYDLHVSENGRAVSRTRFGQEMLASSGTAASAVQELAPGDEVRTTLLINRVYDMSTTGKYTIQVSRDLPNPRGSGFLKITSNRITIEVVE